MGITLDPAIAGAAIVREGGCTRAGENGDDGGIVVWDCRAVGGCTSTMEWTPPPDGIAMCQDGAEAIKSTIWGRRHPHGRGYDHRDRSGKVQLSGTRGEDGRVGCVPQEAEPREAAGLSRLTAAVYGGDGGVRQRTQTINALRGHLAEYGVVAPQGRARIRQLAAVLEDGDCGLPEAVAELGWLLFGRIDELDEKIGRLDRELQTSARQREDTARLMTIPGVGPVTAMALQAFAPPMESFRRGRDFSAWLGLVPQQHTTGGKPRLGRISKMGQRDLRRLLVTGAMAVVRHASRRSEITDPWLAGMLARKPKKVVAVALANRTARRVWALATRKEAYRVRAAA